MKQNPAQNYQGGTAVAEKEPNQDSSAQQNRLGRLNFSQQVQTKPEQKSFIDRLRNFRVEFGPGRKDILHFTNQLAVMIRAGISLQDSLEAISEQIEKDKFKKIITDLRKQIEAGQSFSQALS